MDADGLSRPGYRYQWVRVASGGVEDGHTAGDFGDVQGDCRRRGRRLEGEGDLHRRQE